MVTPTHSADWHAGYRARAGVEAAMTESAVTNIDRDALARVIRDSVLDALPFQAWTGAADAVLAAGWRPPDPAPDPDDGPVFKLRIAEPRGVHVTVTVFTSRAWDQTFANAGSIILRESEVDAFRRLFPGPLAAPAQAPDGSAP
jgi:hypothetical protein